MLQQDSSVVELNFEDLPKMDFELLEQQDIPMDLMVPSLSNNIATFSTIRHVDFDDFKLKAGHQYGLMYEIVYSKSPYFYLEFKPDRTCNMCVGLLKSSDLSAIDTKKVSVTANKKYKVKYTLNKGNKVCAMIFNNTPYTMSFSNVSIEHYIC